jgi:hypothetical protein
MGSALLAGLLLSGCDSQADEQEKLANAWQECIEWAVDRLDDGKSDLASAVYRIAPECGNLYDEWTEAMVPRNVTKRRQTIVRDRMRDKESVAIAANILAHRTVYPHANGGVERDRP